MEEASDIALIGRYRRGEVRALEQLVEKYRRPLFGFIINMTGSRNEADEVFQEVWFRVIRKLAVYKHKNFLGWLLRIAHNQIIDRARRRKPDMSLDEERDDGRRPAEMVAAAGLQGAIRPKLGWACLIGTLLELHSNAILVSTDEVADELEVRLSNYDELQDRVRAFAPEEGERVQVSASGVDLEILNLPHDWPVTNLGFIISIGGKKLLHTGDTFPPHLRSYSFPGDNLDVAFVPYFFLTEQQYLEEGKSVILDAIQAERLVPMHHSPTQPGLEADFEKIATNCPEAILFYEPMQTHVIE